VKNQAFFQVALNHPDPSLCANKETSVLSEEQRERMCISFSVLTPLFERAYLLLYKDGMKKSR
jgi:hypothetical protein